MARPARRRPTLPDHDPRAIRAALRREVYAIGDARRQLDEIEFRTAPPAEGTWSDPGPGVEVIVNGVSTTQTLGWDPVPAWLQWIPSRSLRDHDGSRLASFAVCQCGVLPCEELEAGVEVAGRYIIWRTAARHFGGPLVFDRASYRGSLEVALAAIRADESFEDRALRDILERGAWAQASERGLRLHDAALGPDGLVIEFLDRLWRATVWCVLPDASTEPGAVARALQVIARWEEAAWRVEWRPWCSATAVPPYPERWVRTQRADVRTPGVDAV